MTRVLSLLLLDIMLIQGLRVEYTHCSDDEYEDVITILIAASLENLDKERGGDFFVSQLIIVTVSILIIKFYFSLMYPQC